MLVFCLFSVCRIAFAQFCSYFILTLYLFNVCFSLTLRFILLRFDYIVSLWFALFMLIVGSLEISFVSGITTHKGCDFTGTYVLWKVLSSHSLQMPENSRHGKISITTKQWLLKHRFLASSQARFFLKISRCCSESILMVVKIKWRRFKTISLEPF